MHIRPWRSGEEAELRQVFESALYGKASRYYDAGQIQAWAARSAAPKAWQARIQATAPWVCEIDGAVAAYADVQASGYIDQFFVTAAYAGQGVGTRLLQHLAQQALQQGCPRLWANVSLAAEAFFSRHGFVVQERRLVQLQGLALAQARMEKQL